MVPGRSRKPPDNYLGIWQNRSRQFKGAIRNLHRTEITEQELRYPVWNPFFKPILNHHIDVELLVSRNLSKPWFTLVRVAYVQVCHCPVRGKDKDDLQNLDCIIVPVSLFKKNTFVVRNGYEFLFLEAQRL